jgi:Histidine phosphatase superfamily (branch 1)
MHLRAVEECPDKELGPLAPYEKCVWLVRHGESFANTYAEHLKLSMVQELTDSKLTPRGEKQAMSLQSKVAVWKPQVVLSRYVLVHS